MPYDPALAERLVRLAALDEDVNPDLAVRLTRHESGMKAQARSPKGALGPMQLMPGTAHDLGVNPHDPADNITGGVRYLKQQLNRFGGDERLALAAYNAGPGAVQKYGGVPPYQETQQYVNTIAGPQPTMQGGSGMTRTEMEQRLRRLDELDAREASGTPPTAAPAPQPAMPAADTWEGALPEVVPNPDPTQPALLRRSGESSPTGVPHIVIEKATGAQTAPTPGAIEWLPGFEFLSVLPVSAQQKVIETVPGLVKQVAPTVISTALGVGGAAGGAALGGPPGAVAGEVLGSAAARWLNVKLGLEEPGLVGDIAAVAVPPALRGAARVTKGVVRNLPGAGVVKHEMAEEGLEALGTRLTRSTLSREFYDEAARQGANVRVTNMGREAQAILQQQRLRSPDFRLSPTTMRRLEQLLDLPRQHRGTVPLDVLQDRHQVIRQLMDDATGPEKEALRRIHSAIYDDLDAAAAQGVRGAELIKRGNEAYRHEKALDTFKDLWSPGKGTQYVEGDTVQIYGKRIQNQFEKAMRQDKRFANSFTPEELKDIRDTLRFVARLTPSGPLSGRRQELTQAAQWVGRGLGWSSGNVPLILATEGLPSLIAAGMQTAAGRAAVRRAMQEGGGHLTAAGIAMINQAVRGGLEMPGMEPGPSGTAWEGMR
jgi:hypothetical protein